MLVLSRKKNESIVIDGNIVIEVVQVKGNQVRLGINAPRNVRILRGELKPFDVVPSDVAASDVAPSDVASTDVASTDAVAVNIEPSDGGALASSTLQVAKAM